MRQDSRVAADHPDDPASLPLLPVLGLVGMARRKRHSPDCDQSSRCGCLGELRVKVDRDGELEVQDPDSMEDEHLPYVWNRRSS